MSQEGIWEKSLNDEVDHQHHSISIRRNFPYELNDISLRNYFNIHKLEDISIETLYDYFKDNMFKDFEGFYLPHLLCRVAFTDYKKVYKAMEEVFKVMSPNIGTNNEHNMNYFQYHMTIWRNERLVLLQYYFKDLYELGLKYNLDQYYRDHYGYTNLAYYFASAPKEEIFVNYKFFIPAIFTNEYYVLENRVVDTRYTFDFSGANCDRLERLERKKLFQLISYGLSEQDMIITHDKEKQETEEYQLYKEIKTYMLGKKN